MSHPPLRTCGWPGEQTRRPHCDGAGTYVDSWDGRLVHVLMTGHRPVPPELRPDPEARPIEPVSVSEAMRW